MRCRKLKFILGDKVFMKVSPMKGVMHFGKKGKFSPHLWIPIKLWRRLGNWLMSWIFHVRCPWCVQHLTFLCWGCIGLVFLTSCVTRTWNKLNEYLLLPDYWWTHIFVRGALLSFFLFFFFCFSIISSISWK